MSALILLLLSQANVEVSGPLSALTDGGVGIQVTCDNCGSGGSAPGGGLTNVELRALPVLVDIYSDGGAGVSGLTDSQLRATAVPVSVVSMPSTPVTGTFWQATQPVSGSLTCSGPLTDAQLRAVPVPVSMASTTVTGTVAVSGPATDAQLRATPLPVSGTVATTGTYWQATQPVSIASMPTTAVTGTFWQATQPVSGTVTANAGTGTMNVSCVSGCGSPAVPVVYRWSTPNAVAGASKLHADFFNASGSGKVIKVLGVYPAIKTDVAVVGAVALRFDLYRTSAAGTGGTAASYKSATIDVAGGNITPADTSNANLPAQVTARHLPTGGATISEWIQPAYCFVEETNAATYWCNGTFNVLDTGNWTVQALTLREGQGLLLKQGTVATLNQIAFSVVFSVE